MKVLNCCSHDYANFSHDNANALRSVGVDCQDVKLNTHEFGYEYESDIVTREGMIDEMIYADIIQIFHTDVIMLELAKGLGKRIVVYYCDSRYRSNPSKYNALFNPYVETSVIALGEFAGLGAKNEQYVVGAIDVEGASKLKKRIRKPFVIGHFPSNAKVKGTEKILNVLSKVKGKHDLHHSIEIVNHQEQQHRYSDTDIYIELFNPELNGKKYGSFGITALEVAALGKIVITQNLSSEVYKKAYGDCALILCTNEVDLRNNIEQLLKFDKKQIGELQLKTYNWVKEKHSYKATGERLKQILKL